MIHYALGIIFLSISLGTLSAQRVDKSSYLTHLNYGKGCEEFHFFISYPASYERLKAENAWQPCLLISTHMGILQLDTFEKEVIFGKKPMHRLLFQISEQYGLPLITFNTPQGNQPFYSRSFNDRNLPEAQHAQLHSRFKEVSGKWMECLKQFCAEQSLPADDFIGSGASNGAQWISRVAMLYPQDFYAIDSNIPSSCPVPAAQGKKIHWLQISGAIDSGYEKNSQFYIHAVTKGYENIYFLAPHKLSHGNWLRISDAQRFRAAFYHDLLGMGKRTENREKLFVGDFVNNVVSPKAHAAWIPEEQRVYFHSREFASQWGTIREPLK